MVAAQQQQAVAARAAHHADRVPAVARRERGGRLVGVRARGLVDGHALPRLQGVVESDCHAIVEAVDGVRAAGARGGVDRVRGGRDVVAAAHHAVHVALAVEADVDGVASCRRLANVLARLHRSGVARVQVGALHKRAVGLFGRAVIAHCF